MSVPSAKLLKEIKCYVYYDGPLLWSATFNDATWLVVALPDELGEQVWLVSRVDPIVLAAFEGVDFLGGGDDSFRAAAVFRRAVQRSEDRWVIRIKPFTFEESAVPFPGAVPDDWLPGEAKQA